MEYRTLGSSGAVVSTYCLGTMTFGAETDEVPTAFARGEPFEDRREGVEHRGGEAGAPAHVDVGALGDESP